MSILAYREKDGTVNIICAGKAVRDAEVKQTNNGTRVRFSVNYGKSKFMDCEAWADNDVGSIASLIEKGDYIAVMGTHRSWEYNGKQYESVTADMIFTLNAPPAVQTSPQEEVPQPSQKWEELRNDNDELPF